MKLAIIEDEQVHRDLLTSYVQNWGILRNTAVDIRHFVSAEQFLFEWESEPDFELLFVDIQMSGMDGMAMVRKIRETDDSIIIVFTTGITDYLEEGYEVAALHYLLKPISEDKVRSCLDRAAAKHREESFVLVHEGEDIRKLMTEKINFVEAMGHGSIIGIADSGTIQVKEGISELERVLEPGKFIKCHRSYLCRLGSIYRIDKDTVLLDDGSRVPVSRRMYQEVNQAFIRYYSRIREGGNRLKDITGF